MKNRAMGFVILLLGGSLLLNGLAFYTLTTTPEKVETIQQKYDKDIEKKDKKIQNLTNYIDANTSTALEKIEADKKVINQVLYSLFEYTPKTKDNRFKPIEALMTPEVFEELVPPVERQTTEKTTTSAEEETHNHTYKMVDEQETVSIKNITFYSALNGDYLVRYDLTYQFPKRDELSYTALTHIKMTDNIISLWDQHTIEFKE